MLQTDIIYPVFVQVLLTLVVLVMMGPARSRSMRERRQRLEDIALATDADWDAPARQVANNYKNQFELPVLFYAVAAFALITHAADLPMQILAWVFVISRIVHAIVHIGPNKVPARVTAFLVGVVAIALMWLLLLFHVATAGI